MIYDRSTVGCLESFPMVVVILDNFDVLSKEYEIG